MRKSSNQRERAGAKRRAESVKIESRRLGKREKGEMMQSKREKREEWSGANGERRQRGSDNGETSPKRGEMMRKRRRRRTNGGPLCGSKMFFAPVRV